MPCSTSLVLCRKIVKMPFITFEGSEGCGKTTQVIRLAAYCEKRGILPAVFREPGGTAIGEAIRQLLQHSEQNRGMAPETELLLFEASRSQLVREQIQSALDAGKWVICDRFFDSTTVYQGAARKLDSRMVEELNRFATGPCTPDMTLLLDIDRQTAEARLKTRRIRDRMEEESAEFYDRVRLAYRELARREPERIVIIDGRCAAEAVERQIQLAVEKRFPQLLSDRAAGVCG